MNLDEFLEKYNCAMNPKEIDAIKDINIKNIKRKYWDLKHKAFLDEHNIADTEIDNVYDSLTQKERKELEEYYNTL
jgi:hypothetical protein